MSSLRVSVQSRPIGEHAAANNDVGRGDAPADGSSFAAALGTAGAPAGGGSGNDAAPAGGGDSGTATATPSRKPAKASGDPADAAAMLALPGLVLPVPDPAGVAPAEAGSDTVCAPTDASPGLAAAPGSTLAAAVAPGGAGGTTPLAPASAPQAAVPAVAGTAGAAVSVDTTPAAPNFRAAAPGAARTGQDRSASSTPPPSVATVGDLPPPAPALPPELLARLSPTRVPRDVPRPAGTSSATAAPPTTTGAAPAGVDPGTVAADISTIVPTDAPALPATGATPGDAVGALAAAPLQPAIAVGTSGAGSGTGDRDSGRFADMPAIAEGRVVEGAGAAQNFGSAAAPGQSTSVTDTGVLAAADPGGTIPDQVSGQVVRMVAVGPREMVIRLHPPELGDLTVRVEVNGRDVQAWFASPQAQVQSAISDGMGQLHAGLGHAGYNLNGTWVGADASNARQQNPSPPPQPPPSFAPGTARGFAPSAAATAPGAPASGLNIYV